MMNQDTSWGKKKKDGDKGNGLIEQTVSAKSMYS
jgi:hypothetical protein